MPIDHGNSVFDHGKVMKIIVDLSGHPVPRTMTRGHSTATDKQEYQITHAPETQKNEFKNLVPAKINIKVQNSGIDAFHGIRPANRVGLFLQSSS